MLQNLLYLVTLFTIRAIADDAFKAGYQSCDQVLRLGPLEKGVNCVRLGKGLKKKEDCPNIIQSDFAVLDIWYYVHFVAGSREKKRSYTLRVGAGGRLDGKSASMVA